MTEKNKMLLESEWKNLIDKVIFPLWNGKYKPMYESLKLDYDDFLSLAGYELTKAIHTFDSSKSNLYTFATNVIKRKANTELRDYGNREKRKTLSLAKSLNCSPDDGCEEINDIPVKAEESISILSEKRVGEYLNNLSSRQLRIIVLKLLDFNIIDIQQALCITKKELNDILKGLKNNELRRILSRRKF